MLCCLDVVVVWYVPETVVLEGYLLCVGVVCCFETLLVGFAFANSVGLCLRCWCRVLCTISLCVGFGFGSVGLGWVRLG